MKLFIEIGDKFTKWTVVGKAVKDKYGHRMWPCKCECGVQRLILEANLTNGLSKGCRNCGPIKQKHPRLRIAFEAMHNRTTLISNQQFKKYYIDKGIVVEAVWNRKTGFQAFVEWSILNGYEEGKSLHRKENDKNYGPQNCAWITREENSRLAAQGKWHGKSKE